jgi:hypothetical protein
MERANAANALTLVFRDASQFCDVHVQQRRAHGAAAVSRFTVEQISRSSSTYRSRRSRQRAR